MKVVVQTMLLLLFLLIIRSSAKTQPSVAIDSAKQALQRIIEQLPDSAAFTIRTITVKGNRITKAYILYREIPFKKGSRVEKNELAILLEQARQNMFNTQLFLEVIPGISGWEQQSLDIVFTVRERWYLFPLPHFKLIDRNFNQWWVEQKHDFRRTTYGVKLNWENVSGRRDKLSFNYFNGYAKQVSLYYEQPYADQKLEKGFLFGVRYAESRQLSFATDENRQVFYPSSVRIESGFVRSSFRAEAGFSLRKGAFHRHAVRLSYSYETVPDTLYQIADANQSKGFVPFFTGRATRVKFGELSYGYQFLKLDNLAYPLEGIGLSLGFLKRGLGNSVLNLWQLNVKMGNYVRFNPKTSLSVLHHAVLKLPFRQPMYNLSLMGYGDMYLRGLEYYIIDGVAAGMLKTTLRRELFQLVLPTYIIKNEKYRKIPFKFVVKVFGDLGGAHASHPSNSVLNNRLLYSYGAGIDVLSYYDFIARFEYSFNQLGGKGLFLHMSKDF